MKPEKLKDVEKAIDNLEGVKIAWNVILKIEALRKEIAKTYSEHEN